MRNGATLDWFDLFILAGIFVSAVCSGHMVVHALSVIGRDLSQHGQKALATAESHTCGYGGRGTGKCARVSDRVFG